MTADISRHSLRPLQNYTGVVRQQGRLPLDAEETEGGDIGAAMLRDTIAETICEKGAPGDSFLVGAPQVTAEGVLDFTLEDGGFYLAGLRCTTSLRPGSGAARMTYQAQPDWLQLQADDAGPTLPEPGTRRRDLVWLHGWEQTVTATEDAELFEVALGGADSSARRRVMSRVRVIENVPDTCPDAFADLVAREFPGGTLDPDGCEVLSDTSLTIGFTTLDPLNDLCRPSAQAGFLGARNETFRVQVTEPGRFLWGRDNAAPLFRVQVQELENGGGRRRIAFLTPPRDEFGWPLAGMTVELLRWGALLDNGEKVAEPIGLLLRVENGYDPATDSIIVSADVPQAFDDWFASAEGLAAVNPLDDAEAGLHRYHYLRLWTGGGEDANAVDNAIDLAQGVPLGETGLTALFSGNGMPGDYWIVSARPNTPTRVTPHKLLTGAPPVGPRRLVAPLALLPWDGPVPGRPHDCRHRFRPLCQIGGCCRVTVGDGLVSHGDVTSIQEAVDRLPPEGGEICIHEGHYVESVRLRGLRNVTITGCGRGTHWRPDPDSDAPALTIFGCRDIHVRRLDIVAGDQEGILSSGAIGVTLEDLRVAAGDRAAISCRNAREATVRRCEIILVPTSVSLAESTVEGRAAAIFLGGTDLLVEDCRIAPEVQRSRLFLPAGGIHIAGQSARVIIRDNVIAGGNGHGITLGTVQYLPDADTDADDRIESAFKTVPSYRDATTGARTYHGLQTRVDAAGCLQMAVVPTIEALPPNIVIVPESGGLVRQVRILRNDISGMGFSGISAHVFSGLGQDGLSDLVGVESVEISENRITGCMINEALQTTPLLQQFIGWGGIALSLCSDATIRDNLIAHNGTGGLDPICGIFMAIAEDVRIERNRIENNGRTPPANAALPPGRRGGVVIGLTMGGVSSYEDPQDPSESVDRPALLMSGNTVDAPGARALKAIAMGPVMVLGNRLTGAGASAAAANPFVSLGLLGLSLGRLGGQLTDPSAEIDFIDYVALEILSNILGGDSVNLINLCVAEEIAIARSGQRLESAYRPERLRGGEMLINDNQIALRPFAEPGARTQQVTLSSILLYSADDLSFCNNQCEIDNAITFTLSDLIALGATMRTSSNRLQKATFGGILSAVTFAFMNQTALNQSTHCLFATGPSNGRVIRDNRTLIGLLGSSFCNIIEEFALGTAQRQDTKMNLAQRGG